MKDLADDSLSQLEQKRAREIDAQYGPKSSDTPACDFIFDLHTTTANTGIALMMHPKDDFAHEVAAHLISLDAEVRVCQWADKEQPMLPTIGRSGMTFEVGALPWGCIEPVLFQRTHTLLLAAHRCPPPSV